MDLVIHLKRMIVGAATANEAHVGKCAFPPSSLLFFSFLCQLLLFLHYARRHIASCRQAPSIAIFESPLVPTFQVEVLARLLLLWHVISWIFQVSYISSGSSGKKNSVRPSLFFCFAPLLINFSRKRARQPPIVYCCRATRTGGCSSRFL